MIMEMKFLLNFLGYFLQDTKLVHQYQTSMRGDDFIFDSVQLLYYKCYKTNFKSGGSYIDSLDWIKKKKTIKKNDDR